MKLRLARHTLHAPTRAHVDAVTLERARPAAARVHLRTFQARRLGEGRLVGPALQPPGYLTRARANSGRHLFAWPPDASRARASASKRRARSADVPRALNGRPIRRRAPFEAFGRGSACAGWLRRPVPSPRPIPPEGLRIAATSPVVCLSHLSPNADFIRPARPCIAVAGARQSPRGLAPAAAETFAIRDRASALELAQLESGSRIPPATCVGVGRIGACAS